MNRYSILLILNEYFSSFINVLFFMSWKLSKSRRALMRSFYCFLYERDLCETFNCTRETLMIPWMYHKTSNQRISMWLILGSEEAPSPVSSWSPLSFVQQIWPECHLCSPGHCTTSPTTPQGIFWHSSGSGTQSSLSAFLWRRGTAVTNWEDVRNKHSANLHENAELSILYFITVIFHI